MGNKKGFTLVELIGIIIIFSFISILAFTSFTKMMKNAKLDELENYKDKLINSATLYVETNLSNFPTLENVGGSITISATTLSDEGYISNDIKAPDDCNFDSASITATKNEDYTISYSVTCS